MPKDAFLPSKARRLLRWPVRLAPKGERGSVALQTAISRGETAPSLSR